MATRQKRREQVEKTTAVSGLDADTAKSELAKIQQIFDARDEIFRVQRKKSSWNKKRADAMGGNQSLQQQGRQGEDSDSDPFTKLYSIHQLIEPRYPFLTSFDLVECSDVLQNAIRSWENGIHGTGHTFQFAGDDKRDRRADLTLKNERFLFNFFDRVNEEGSFIWPRKRLCKDLGSVGNGALEVFRHKLVRNITAMYHQPITYCRMAVPDEEPTEFKVKVMRDGTVETTTYYKRFRRYARMFPSGKIRWFKEFQDPRILDRDTGKYVTMPNGDFLLEPAQYPNKATELWWWKLPFRNEDYGAAPWTGCVDTIKGRILASYVNWDIFNNQGVPPLLLIAEGGAWTRASVQEVENTLEAWRDPEKFNRVCMLQVVPLETFAWGDKGLKPTVKVHKLREARAEDYMFQEFLDYAENTVNHAFGLPGLVQGDQSKSSTMAAAQGAQNIVEQYTFQPMRNEFDEAINIRLLQNEFGIFDWKFVSKRPRITGSEELTKIIRTFALSGGANMNQVTQLANEMLGTNWSEDDSPLSKIPVVFALALTRLGRVNVDDQANMVVLTPRQALGQVAIDGEPTGNLLTGDAVISGSTSDTDNPGTPQTNSQGVSSVGKADDPLELDPVVSDAVDLLRALGRVHEEFETYDPGEITEVNFKPVM